MPRERRHDHRSLPGRRRLRALLSAAALAVAGGTAVPAALADQTLPAPPEIRGAGQQHQVTLLTGDIVRFAKTGTGRYAVTMDPGSPASAEPIPFTTRQTRSPDGHDHLYVYPAGVTPYLRSGAVDETLFDVTELVREGRDDSAGPTLPLILTYRGAPSERSMAASADALPASTPAVTIDAVHAAAVRVDRAGTATFWRSLVPTGKTTALAHGIARVSLDRKVTVADDVSNAQIGVPIARRKGLDGTGVTVAVVDTGIDAGHADLAGKVVEAKNFTPDENTTDGHGHGTHVASIVAGTGAASGEKYAGVAPKAKLLNAKVLDSGGSGDWSWVMAGMEWAADHGAKVINVSVGGAPTDGTDEVSRTVDALTARTGALFVIAAGNLGANTTVSTPGAATSALTVGAVDSKDGLAGFSSRGPRWGDAAVKPEITAPGVRIAAARAAGTSLGEPIDDNYTRLSGTSMATPHVAGAAALMVQAHPGAKAADLKDTLVSTAKDTGRTWYEQGAGRLDVGRAATQPLTGPASIGFGTTQGGTPVTRTLTYTNAGDAAITVRLKLALTGFSGRPVASRVAKLSTTRLTVPAKGRATAELIIDPGPAGIGAFGGLVTATSEDGTTAARTSVSFYAPQPASVPLTIRALGYDGKPAQLAGVASVIRDDLVPATNDDPFALGSFDPVRQGDDQVVQVPPGTYTVIGYMYESGLVRHRLTYLSTVDARVGGATTITLDARRAVKAEVGTQEPADHLSSHVAFGRLTPNASVNMASGSDPTVEVYATPTKAAKQGSIALQQLATFGQPVLTARAGGAELHPLYEPYGISAKLAGVRNLPLVWAGQGTPEDFAKIDVRNKAALVGVTVPADVENPIYEAVVAANEAAANAAEAGATAVVSYVDAPGAAALGPLYGGVPSDAIGHLSLNQSEGTQLREKVSGGAVTLELSGRANPQWLATVHYGLPDSVPADLVHMVRRTDLTKVDTRYHADVPGLKLQRSWYALRKNVGGALVPPKINLRAPLAVTEYVGPNIDLDEMYWIRFARAFDPRGNAYAMWNQVPFRRSDDWFQGPLAIGSRDPAYPDFNRVAPPSGADVFITSQYMTDSTDGHLLDVNGSPSTWEMFRDGKPVPGSKDPFSRVWLFPMPADPGTYELRAVTELPEISKIMPSQAVTSLAPRVDTTWTFRSRHTEAKPCYEGSPNTCAPQPMLRLDFDLRLDLGNAAPAGKLHKFEVTAGQTAGAPDTGKIAGLTMSCSTDEGGTWQQAKITRLGGGRFQAEVSHPELTRTSGEVWLRTDAWDNNGNKVTQTVQRAYKLA